jgi:DNA (cytosine-5)-methyltransferase 1
MRFEVRQADPEFIIIDLFCGAGGTTQGYVESELAVIAACVNHDHKAIESHWRNHPDVEHFNEDITLMYGYARYGVFFKSPEMLRLMRLIDLYRAFYPNAVIVLWASLECTNFSKAKGGQPKDADSRTLAKHLQFYIHCLDPDYIKIENVVEFLAWGPLRIAAMKIHKTFTELKLVFSKKTKRQEYAWVPLSKKNGSDWLKWCEEIRSFGYSDEWNQLNSADFGARTSRNRLFGMFAKNAEEIAWPEPTHCKNPSKGKLIDGGLKKWEACRPCLDLEDKGTSVFTPGKIKSHKTWERLLAGLIRFVALAGYKEFITKYFSGNDWSMNISTEQPAGAIRTKDGQAIVQTEFLSKNYSGKPEGKNIPVTGPSGVITTFGGSHSLVQSEFIVQRNSGDPSRKVVDTNGPSRTITATGGNQDVVSPEFLLKYNSTDAKTGEVRNASLENPAPTIPCQRHPKLVQSEFLSMYYSSGGTFSSINDPAPTIPGKDRMAKVKAEWLDRQFSSGTKLNDVDTPAGALLSVPKMNLVHTEPFISDTNFNNVGQSVEQPLGTITANRKWHYLMNPQYMNSGSSIEDPCFTLIARMDKAPPYLVQTEEGKIAIEVYETDHVSIRKVKYFMAMYGIVDIKMRMLKVSELKRIQGFPEEYVLIGNQADQKKQIGNSVHPMVVKAWAHAISKRRRELREERVAA